MKDKAAAIGTFDGVHLGHQSVLKALVEYSLESGMEPIVITFDCHPLTLIDSSRIPKELTPLWKKQKLLEEYGVTPMIFKFDENLRATTAEEWMKRLHQEYGVKALILGYDNTFGSDGIKYSLADYRKLGESLGIDVLCAEQIKGVSSSAIRKAVKSGEMERAGEMLGRPYSITGKVIEGNSLGRTLGFPTANLEIPEGAAIPPPGAYSAVVKILSEGKKYQAMVNVGTRPTVMRGDKPVIEAHILNWNGDLYGKDITVRFLRRLRDEKKFDSIEGLRQQLLMDKEEVMKENR